MKIYRRKGVRRMERVATRVLLGAGAAAVFVVAAVLVEPEDSGAVSAPRAPEAQEQTAPAQAEPEGGAERVSLGELIGVHHRVHIVATPEGPRYTALDSLGNIIATNLHADEVYQVVPDADVQSMLAGRLMLADIKD